MRINQLLKMKFEVMEAPVYKNNKLNKI